MTDHDEHPRRNRFHELEQADLWVVLVDRQQRGQRKAKTSTDHRLHGPVVIGAENDARPYALTEQKLLSVILIRPVLITDHRQAGQVAGAGPAAGQRRARTRHQHIWILHQLADLKGTIRDGLDGKAEIKLASFDRIDELPVMRGFGHPNVHRRPALFEPAHDLRQHLIGHALVDADPQAARLPGGIGVEVGLGRPQPRLDGLGMPEQNATCFSQLDRAPAPRTLDQALADQGLERGDVVADRGKRAVQQF